MAVGIALKAGHLKRYKDIALIMLKYGRSDLVKSAGLDDALSDEARAAPGSSNGSPGIELAADLERLGPTFIKLGQLLSTRPDILPPAYIQGLCKLQDDIEPFPFDEVEAILHVELLTQSAWGRRSTRPEPPLNNGVPKTRNGEFPPFPVLALGTPTIAGSRDGRNPA